MRVLFIQTLSVEGVSQERVYPIGLVILAGSLQDRGYLEALQLSKNVFKWQDVGVAI